MDSRRGKLREWALARIRQPALAVIVVLLSMFLPLVALFAIFGSLIISHLLDFLHNIPAWINQGQEALKKYSPQLGALWAEYGMSDRLRNLLPFKNVLRYFLYNIFDGISFELEKVAGSRSTRGCCGNAAAVVSGAVCIFCDIVDIFCFTEPPGKCLIALAVAVNAPNVLRTAVSNEEF